METRGGRTAVLSGLVWLVVGCGAPDLEARLARYHEAVREVFDAGPIALRTSGDALRLPRRRERMIEVEARTLSGFDFLAIQGCTLSELVGHRNSPLGRQMPASRRLIYELEVIESAESCLETLGQERAVRLRSVFGAKRRELGRHVWNALWAGEELEDYLSTTRQPRAFGADPEAAAGLDEVTRVLRRPVRDPKDGRALEAALGQIGAAYPMGPTLQRLDALRHHLDGVAELVETRDPIACRGDVVRLASLFDELYLPLQREIAALDRRAAGQLEALTRLLAESQAQLVRAPDAMSRYRALLDPAARDGLWQRYREALRRHTSAWGPILTRCGRLPRPGGPSR